MKRPTIIDIAREVGVSKAAVSYALNGRAGVSPQTRERILDVAAAMGWRASSAARALSNDRAANIGIVLARSPEVLRTEPFFMQMLAGLEQTLSAEGFSLQLALAADTGTELDTYRRWWAERRVDGVVLTDLRVSDPRPELLRELGTPAVFFGTAGPMPGIPVLRADEDEAIRSAITHLAELGHRRIGHVQGPADLQHTVRRADALRRAVGETPGLSVHHASGDYTEEGGVRATRRLLSAPNPPTAVIYDNDVMAVATVVHAEELGVRVPADLSVLAWDDSMLCQVVRPAITAFAHSVVVDSATAARMLLELIETGSADDGELSPRKLMPRGSTAPAPGN
ncbi:transcriptional regulator, LacI family [Saccharopolyspora shandongensis]|uniref:Transcriptional regulator, LacI family n=1 Tax=Saccharopolyspora shandongensis TaxID=418495 RepID=A0A1H3QH66_9PSEU|nr:LacI family DNA-binding transcriptional regulator [Saccharopolyspora shandongensis]SDZ12630.1 transcriptional regulator, LacI family [Saccharopolyspora shandongensis]